MQLRRVALVLLAAVLFAAASFATPILIDTPLPAPGPSEPPSPWSTHAAKPTITYAFMTSWDGIAWSTIMQTAALAAIGDLDDQALPYHALAQGNPDFTIRWAGADFFKDWRDGTHTEAGWDITSALAVAYKHNNGPWDHTKYPNNEIYFNTGYTWSYGLFSVDPDGYDFWTVLQHEIIHMLACDDHADHEEEVMYPYVAKGVRKYLQDSDRDILRRAGYIPEPGAFVLVLSGAVLIALGVRRRRLHH